MEGEKLKEMESIELIGNESIVGKKKNGFKRFKKLIERWWKVGERRDKKLDICRNGKNMKLGYGRVRLKKEG